jgi:hypothetical protein
VADWTAITGIVVSGVAGPGIAAFFAERRLSREQRNTRRQADRGELRALLDQAAQDLREADRNRGAVHAAFMRLGVRIGESQATIDALGDIGRRIDVTDERIALFLGPDSEAAKAHRAALGALVEVHRVAQAAAALKQDNSEIDKDWKTVKAGAKKYHAARQRFVEAAHGAAGTELD